MYKIKIMVVDDQQLIREGISIILNTKPDLEVVAVADNGQAALDLLSTHHPDVVLLDIQMPQMSGLEVLRQIKAISPNTVVVMLTTFDPDEYIIAAFRYGAAGYLLKDFSAENLVLSIRNAYLGNITIPAPIANRLLDQLPPMQKDSLANYNLTQREKEIAELMTKGYLNERIAETLGISLGTVKNYISTLYSKLEVRNRKEAVLVLNNIKSHGWH